MPETGAASARDDLVQFLRKLLIAVAVGALALVALRWHHVFLLAFGAALLAVALRALADPIRRRTPLGPDTSLAVAVAVLMAVLIGVSWFAGAQIARQLTQLQTVLPQAWTSAQEQIGQYVAGRWVLDRLHEATGGPMNGFGAIAGRIGRITSVSAQAAAELVVVLVAGVYFAAQPGLYRRGLLKLAPAGSRERLTEAADDCGLALRKWLLGTALAMVAMGVIVGVGAALLGLPAPLALGLLSGVAEFVPIVGAAVSAAPALLLAATKGGHAVLWTLGFYVAAHQFEGHVLIPLIQRRVVAVPPALTLFSVVGFGVLFGPSGVIFATPLTVVVLVLIKRLYLHETDADSIDGEQAGGGGKP